MADFIGFADEILDIAWDGGDVDGAIMQEIAEEYGLIEKREMTEPCSENCTCAELAEFPVFCYWKTYTKDGK